MRAALYVGVIAGVVALGLIALGTAVIVLRCPETITTPRSELPPLASDTLDLVAVLGGPFATLLGLVVLAGSGLLVWLGLSCEFDGD